MNTTQTKQMQLGEEVRKQGGHDGQTVTDLVFDPTSCEFRVLQPGEVCDGNGMIVTDMTSEGFAS